MQQQLQQLAQQDVNAQQKLNAQQESNAQQKSSAGPDGGEQKLTEIEELSQRYEIDLNKVTILEPNTYPQLVLQRSIAPDITIADLCKYYPPIGWEECFRAAVDEIQEVSEFLQAEEAAGNQFYPCKAELFQALDLTKPNAIKVVILGQDPYPQTINLLQEDGSVLRRSRCMGMSFSAPDGDEIPKSLMNIYKEIANEMRNFVFPTTPNLSRWARQGILLFNTCLTIDIHDRQRHRRSKRWLGFTARVIKHVEKNNPDCIYLLWGNDAQKLAKDLLRANARILQSSHPSPLSANKGRTPFMGNGHFAQVNDILLSLGKAPIDWNVLSASELLAAGNDINYIKKDHPLYQAILQHAEDPKKK